MNQWKRAITPLYMLRHPKCLSNTILSSFQIHMHHLKWFTYSHRYVYYALDLHLIVPTHLLTITSMMHHPYTSLHVILTMYYPLYTSSLHHPSPSILHIYPSYDTSSPQHNTTSATSLHAIAIIHHVTLSVIHFP